MFLSQHSPVKVFYVSQSASVTQYENLRLRKIPLHVLINTDHLVLFKHSKAEVKERTVH